MNRLGCDFILSRFLEIREFATLAVIITVVFSVSYLKLVTRTRVGDIGLVFLWLGAAGNLIERVRFGCVNDYLNFLGFFKFNAWDTLVTFGAALILWNIWKKI
jgi:lipoprotein signal peptidase